MPDPSRPTMLEAEIEAVIMSHHDPKAAARRILKVDRIRRALKLLDDIDSGAVELLCHGSQLESSDAR